MNGVRGPEQVVQIAHHLLVGAAEEECDQIRLTRRQVVEFQQRLGLAVTDETIQASIGITGQISQIGQPGRALVEPLNRQDREELIDGPGVRR